MAAALSTSTESSYNIAEPPCAWHVLSAAEVTAEFGIDPQMGLSTDEATQRTAIHGPNEIPETHKRGPWRIFVRQFTDFMILVLIGAAIISAIIGDVKDTVTIVVIVILNGCVGFIQEFRAQRAIAALKKLAGVSATARRQGRAVTLAASQLVPGDIVLLEPGNVIPADLRLLEVSRLKVDESALTGESVPVEKCSISLADPDLPLGDRRNMAYKGTVVTYGRAAGVAVSTGPQTELGKIAALLQQDGEQQTPLQKRLTQFGQRLGLAAIAACGVVFVLGLWRGEPAQLMFLTAISLAVAAIPEALPAVVTVTLALGARAMAHKHALIRRLPAVETLGSVSFICADKTGTLTENRMRVDVLYADAHTEQAPFTVGAATEPWSSIYRALALSNDATRGDGETIRGDPTEVALYVAAADAGYDKVTQERLAPRIAELPFDSERRCMTTFHRTAQGIIAFTKGAPEVLLDRSRTALNRTGPVPLQGSAISEQADRMAAAGLRVLAVGYRLWPDLPATIVPENVERDLVFLALIGLIDPPREEVGAAVAVCQSAGITAVMITGDHPATACSIASRLGLLDGDFVMTGQELRKLSPQEFEGSVEQIRVYARVAPEQKIRIVQALQDKGHFVAMTGDGVNDAPALRRADVGVAMGLAGTDVAREAAHMVLLDDNFATIVAAVREGRRIFDNIRKFVKYGVTCNSAEVWTLLLAPILGLPFPLLPIHILWINLITDGLPGLALAVEPEEPGIMKRPPRPPRESLFAHGMWQHMIWVGLLMAGTVLFTQAWAYQTGRQEWQTMVFTVLALSQLGHALAVRSEKESLFRQGLWSNRSLLGTVVLTTLLQLATIYIPACNPIFRTEPLRAADLALTLLLSAVVFVAVEIEKWMVRRGWLYQRAGISTAR